MDGLSFFRPLVGTASVALVLHVSIPITALAETPPWLVENAQKANDDLFKPDVSSLYSSNPDESLSITLPSGNKTLTTDSLYYGVDKLDAEQNALPPEDAYEDFTKYRDQRLGDMEMGVGDYAGAGGVNAEANATVVLKNSQNLPSVRTEAFLSPSEKIVTDTAAIEGEFGKCIQVRQTGTVTKTITETREERCETAGYDDTPFVAERSYFGPGETFSFSTDANGKNWCKRGRVAIEVDTAQTCTTLSAFQYMPSFDYASGCGPGCVTLTFRPSVDYQAEPYYWLQNRPRRGGKIVADAEGNPVWAIVWDGQLKGNTASDTVLNLAASDGYTYRLYPTPDFEDDGWRGITRQLTDPIVDPEAQAALRVRKTSVVTSASVIAEGFGPGTTLRRNSSVVATVDGTYAAPQLISPTGPTHTFRVSRTNGLGKDTKVSVRMSFQTTTFSPWLYNAARWQELLEYEESGFCTLKYKIDKTSTTANGCVRSLENGKQTPGFLCGNDIPVDPFTRLPDRGALKFTVTPDCKRPDPVHLNDPEVEDAYATPDNCGPLKKDPQCAFVSRTCIDDLPNGCYAFEEVYQCTDTTDVEVPVREVENVCASSLSCLGDDCTIDTSTDATADLATAAAKLSAVDMIASDMQCTSDPAKATNELEAQAAYDTCQIFQGEHIDCGRVALGLSNCCQTPRGVSLYDYLMLAFSMARLNASITTLGFNSPITSAWASLSDPLRDSYSQLTRPLVEVWESVVGNSEIAKTAASTVSLEAIKQTMMKSAAQWTADIFGTQAANALFSVNGGAAFGAGGLNGGSIAFSAGAQTVMAAVSLAFTIYTVINVLSAILFACRPQEQELAVKRALKSTHYVGTYCSKKVLGACLKRKDSYCVFNSPLSRIMNEQIRMQLGRGWGRPDRPDCSGVTIADLNAVDMEAIDLSEWTGMLEQSELLDVNRVSDIDAMTGTESTLGKALGDLYPRENALERNSNRLRDVELSAPRNDAVTDFGRGVVRN